MSTCSVVTSTQPLGVFRPMEKQSTRWQICKNVNINVSRKHKHTGLIKEICLFSTNVLRGRTLWRRKRCDWPQSLKKRLSLAHFTSPYELLLLTQTVFNSNSCFFLNLGKAVCLIEIGYCRILIIFSDLICGTLKIQCWMLKMRNLIHSKIRRFFKSCVSLLVYVFFIGIEKKWICHSFLWPSQP